MDRVVDDGSPADFRVLFESLPGLYLVLQTDAPRYTIVAASDAFLRATGTSREQLVGRGLFDAFPDPGPAAPTLGLRNLADSLARVLSQRTVDEMQVQKCAIQSPYGERSGEARWWSSANSPVFGPQREVLYLIHRIEDVTEIVSLAESEAARTARLSDAADAAAGIQSGLSSAALLSQAARLLADSQRVGAALRESEARFRRIYEYAATGIAITDISGLFLHCNPAYCALTGYTEQELRHHCFPFVIHPDDREENLALARRLLQGERQWAQIEHRYIAKDGEIVWVQKVVSLLRDEHGAPTHYVALVTDVSERKRVERALRESEGRLRLASEATGFGIFDYDLRSGTLIWSDAAWRLLGLAPCKYGNRELLFGLLHPDDLQSFVQLSAKLFSGATAGPQEFECRIIRPDGQVRWLLNRTESICDDSHQGIPARIVGTMLDITERKHAEEALRQSEAKFRGVISISADAIISIDEEQRITVFNEGAQKIFGYDKAEAIGAPLDLLLPERFRQFHRQHLADFASGQQTARRMGKPGVPIRGRRKNGEEFTADAAISKLDLGGKRLLTVALRDISDQKRVEQEQQFLAEVGSVLASSLNYEDTLASIARLAVRDLAEFCMVEVLEGSVPVSRLIVHRDPEKAAIVDRLRRLQIDRNRPRLGSSVFETKQPLLITDVGPEHLLLIAQNEEHLRALYALGARSYMALPLLAQGQLLGVLVLVSTNAARRYEARDLPLAEELARRAALAVQSARHYQAAQRAVLARDDVLSIVAHDLRNPLNSILLQSELLTHSARGPTVARDAEAIRRSALRMARLIEDLLDVVRLEGGRLSVDLAVIPPAPAVTDAIELQRPLAAAASLTLQCELARQLPEVLADRDRLLQVLANLIDNAIKFTPPGGWITVGAAARGKELLFWVTDTGSGISKEGLLHLFDRFWQARQADRRGVGLGLSIAKGIVEAHSGRLWVESAPGSGSTFYFTIPIVASRVK